MKFQRLVWYSSIRVMQGFYNLEKLKYYDILLYFGLSSIRDID